MEQKKSILFYEICRLCLDEQGHSAIYEIDGLSVDIYKCTGVKVLPADNFPQKICKKCLDIVTKATQLRIEAKRNEYHLKALFGDDEFEKETITITEDAMETVTSPYFDKDNRPTQQENFAIEKFLKARRKLNSSIAEDSSKSKIMQAKNKKNLARQKRKEHEDSDTEYEISETYYIFSDSVTSETSQSDTSQKPLSQKKIKNKDVNMNEHECDVCSKKFNTPKKLYFHQRQHTKNYRCPIDVCGKKFSSKGDVQKHVRTHTGEKPYKCDLCEKSFAQRVTLRSHKENIHSED